MHNEIWRECLKPLINDMTPSCGRQYGVPTGMSDKEFITVVDEFMNIAKTKNLSGRELQHIFRVCAYRVLDYPFD